MPPLSQVILNTWIWCKKLWNGHKFCISKQIFSFRNEKTFRNSTMPQQSTSCSASPASQCIDKFKSKGAGKEAILDNRSFVALIKRPSILSLKDDGIVVVFCSETVNRKNANTGQSFVYLKFVPKLRQLCMYRLKATPSLENILILRQMIPDMRSIK